jgi:molybdopterin converting factor small subunit
MTVLFVLPGYLRPFAEGRREVAVDLEGRTVGDALRAFFERCPGARDRIFAEDGRIRQHVNVFVGDESVRFLGGLEAEVQSGTRITILPAVSGG